MPGKTKEKKRTINQEAAAGFSKGFQNAFGTSGLKRAASNVSKALSSEDKKKRKRGKRTQF